MLYGQTKGFYAESMSFTQHHLWRTRNIQRRKQLGPAKWEKILLVGEDENSVLFPLMHNISDAEAGPLHISVPPRVACTLIIPESPIRDRAEMQNSFQSCYNTVLHPQLKASAYSRLVPSHPRHHVPLWELIPGCRRWLAPLTVHWAYELSRTSELR